MLSGTAVKAAVSYVSDYISKLSLKSYQLFASMYDVFHKESEIPGGSERDKYNARHMMRKMVNSMSAKMEIGSTMASMYLLGNPDHYASHKYVPFAWRQYVQFVRGFWVDSMKEEEEEGDESEWPGQDDEERVRIGRMARKFVPSYSVNDYRYRPADHKAALARLKEEEEPMRLKRYSYRTTETDDEDDVILEKETRGSEENRPIYHPFVPLHALFRSNCITCNFDNLYTMIPNFIGGSIPRSGKGARAAYCMTMLILFKPWRSPSDLKDMIST
ncbi:hypothetical protein B0H13DRAFT_1636202 [Mycena leptocephala]|nr:hypothetical protein B0H13DRAFT_1636202 [Mycena leptocephala]